MRPALADFFVEGFATRLTADLVVVSGQQVVRLTISPYEITGDGTVYALTGLNVTLNSAAPLTVGQPVFGDYVPQTTSGPNQMSGFAGTVPLFIIITNEALSDEMQRLADYRGATGMFSEVRLIEDILESHSLTSVSRCVSFGTLKCKRMVGSP